MKPSSLKYIPTYIGNILERKIGIVLVFLSDELERTGNNVY